MSDYEMPPLPSAFPAEQRHYIDRVAALVGERYAHPPRAHVHSFGCPFVTV